MICVHRAPVDDLVLITVGEDKGDIDTGLSRRGPFLLFDFQQTGGAAYQRQFLQDIKGG